VRENTQKNTSNMAIRHCIESAQNGIMTIKNAHLCPDKDDIKSLGAKMQ
jgi:hypothetical protein